MSKKGSWKTRRSGKGPGWLYGTGVGLLVLLSGILLLARMVSNGSLEAESIAGLRWIPITAALAAGCVVASAAGASSRLLHSLAAAALLLGLLILTGKLLGTERLTGLPYAIGIAAGAALFGALVCAKRSGASYRK